MSRLTIFLGKLIGLFLVIVSLAMLIQKEAIVEAVGELIHHRPTMLVLGMLTLIAGLAMVLGHNVWSGGALPVIVTVLGWLTLIRSVVLLFVPPQVLDRTFEAIRFEQLYYLFVAVPLLLGLYLTYAAFTGRAASVADGR